MNLRALLSLAAALGCLASLGCSQTCDSSNCAGCCDATGVCQQPTNADCGIQGNACVACPAFQTCSPASGSCMLESGTGSPTASTGSIATTGSSSGSAGSTGSSLGPTGGTSGNNTGVNNTGGNDTGGTTGRSTGAAGSSGGSSGSTGCDCAELQCEVIGLVCDPAACSCISAAGSSSTAISTAGTTGTRGSTGARSTGSTGTTSRTGGNTGTTTGTSGSCNVDVSEVVTDPLGTDVCVPDATVVLARVMSAGGSSDYFITDASGYAVAVHKASTTPVSYDPPRGERVSVSSQVSLYTFDGGSQGEIQLESLSQEITDLGPSSSPAFPNPASLSQLDDNSSDSSGLYQYVTVPAGNYTQDNAAEPFLYKTFYDGVTLTLGSSVIYVDTFRFSTATEGCFPTDGGFPNFAQGGFNGVLDTVQVDDGSYHKVVFFGSCDDLGSFGG